MNNISLKDWISWLIALVAIIVAVYFGMKQLEVNRITKDIKSTDSYRRVPNEIRMKIDKIEAVSGSTVTFIIGE